MQPIVYGDFNCPYSYLASQRAEALEGRGHGVDWRAVEHDPRLSMTGTPGAADAERWRRELAEVAGLALPGEHVPTSAPVLISNTYAVTSAYAESLTDGIAGRLRRDVFDAIWMSGAHLSNAYDVRPLIAALAFPRIPVRTWLGLELPRPGLGSSDPDQPTRMLGGTIAPTGAPLTTVGWRRMTGWRRDWLALGVPVLPAVVDPAGVARFGVDALNWLAGSLTGQVTGQVTGAQPDVRRWWSEPANRIPAPAAVVGAES